MMAAAQAAPPPSLSDRRAAAAELLALRGDGTVADDTTCRAVARFYFREARLLDEERFDEWLALLADDLFYWLPLRENRFRRDARAPLIADGMALFDDGKADIALRIGRVASNQAWAEDPPTRHVYLITNVEVFAAAAPDTLEVHSTVIQVRNRGERDESVLHARRRDVLRRNGDGFLIARRLVLLAQSVLQTKNLSAFF